MSARGKGGRGLGKGRTYKPVFNVSDKMTSGDEKPPMYVVKSVINNGKKSVRVYKATYVSRGNVRGYKITVKGKRIGVKPGKAAFDNRLDARIYADFKRGCKYGVDKSSGSCLTKSGRKARDYVKESGLRNRGSKLSEKEAQIAARELNRGRTYSRGKAKEFSASRTRIGSYTKAAKKKRAPSAYNKYMKKNLGSMKNMSKAERKAKFKAVASGWKKLSPAQQAQYK